MATEQVVNIAATMYKARKSMKFLYGERYEAKIRETIPLMKSLAEKWKLPMSQALTRMGQEMKAQGDDGIGLGLLIAAYVEDVEGTFQTAEQ